MERYVGIDIGKRFSAMAIRDERGQALQVLTVMDLAELLDYLQVSDKVIVEWTGGRAYQLLEMLYAQGFRNLYVYEGWLKADRTALGFTQKGDYQDALTLSYVLWASLTKAVPFRLGAVIDYVSMREVYELRRLSMQCERLLKVQLQLGNWTEASTASADAARSLSAQFAEERKALLEELRRRCMEVPSVARLVRALATVFPHSEISIYELAIYLSPLERFSSLSALRRYCDVLPAADVSGGQVVMRRQRGGQKRARVLMHRLLIGQLGIGGESRPRGKWRDYYDRLRQRMGHGQAMIRLMHRLLGIVWDLYWSESELQQTNWEARLQRKRQREQLMEQSLVLVARGLSDREVCRQLGLHRNTLLGWKRHDAQYLERYIRARLEAELQREVSGGEG